MKRGALPEYLVRASTIALLLSLTTLSAAIVRLLLPPAIPTATSARSSHSNVAGLAANRASMRATPASAVSHERRNPFVESSVEAPQVEPANASPLLPPLVLSGTVRHADGRYLAIVQVQDEARLIRAGDSIGPFKVRSIAREHVRLRVSDSTIVVRMIAP